jgi:hypothetical protein
VAEANQVTKLGYFTPGTEGYTLARITSDSEYVQNLKLKMERKKEKKNK